MDMEDIPHDSPLPQSSPLMQAAKGRSSDFPLCPKQNMPFYRNIPADEHPKFNVDDFYASMSYF